MDASICLKCYSRSVRRLFDGDPYQSVLAFTIVIKLVCIFVLLDSALTIELRHPTRFNSLTIQTGNDGQHSSSYVVDFKLSVSPDARTWMTMKPNSNTAVCTITV